MAHVVDPHAFAWLLDEFAKPSPFPLRPKPEPRPDFQADLVRPDDLLTLHVAGYNLKPAGKAEPVLERIDAAKDAVLVVTFPPQNIAETAYYANANPQPPPPLPPGIKPQPSPPPGTAPAPGQTAARLAGFTRLAFRIAAVRRLHTAIAARDLEAVALEELGETQARLVLLIPKLRRTVDRERQSDQCVATLIDGVERTLAHTGQVHQAW